MYVMRSKMDIEASEKINALMLDFSAKLNESVSFVMTNCADEDFKAYRLAIGRIMGAMYSGVMEPIYEAHPSLKPNELL